MADRSTHPADTQRICLSSGLPINVGTFLPAKMLFTSMLSRPFATRALSRAVAMNPGKWGYGSDDVAMAISRVLEMSHMPGGLLDRSSSMLADIVTGFGIGSVYGATEFDEASAGQLRGEDVDDNMLKRFLIGGMFGAGAGAVLGSVGNLYAYSKSLRAVKQGFKQSGIMTDNMVTHLGPMLEDGDLIGGRRWSAHQNQWFPAKGTKAERSKFAKSPLKNFDAEGETVQGEITQLFVSRQIDRVESASQQIFKKAFNALKKEERAKKRMAP